jgi:uncharacterized protein YcbK (DUF882 family)
MWLLSLPWSDRICFSKLWDWWHTTALAVEGIRSQKRGQFKVGRRSLRADQFVEDKKMRARGLASRLCAAFLLSLFSIFAGLNTAAAETRTLKLYHIHTGEKVEITFKRNGRYLNDGLNKLNRELRDWRHNEPIRMDPRLMDVIWEVYKKSGSNGYIHVVCGYRSPATNSMLRRRSNGVAEKSQHMKGKAMDFFIPGVPLKKLRYLGLQLGAGGVGYYPRSGSPFVHLDVGNVRHWPKMSRSELMAVFPTGKTLHVPSDGRPLAGYEVAMASYKSRLKSGSSAKFDNSSGGSSGGGRSLLAVLFGGGADEEEDTASGDEGAPVKPAKPVKQEEVLVAAAPVKKPKIPAKPEEEVLVAALPQRTTPAPLAVVRPPEDLKSMEEAAPEALAFAVPVPARKPRTNPVLTAPTAETALAARMALGEKPANEQAVVQMAAADPQAEAEAIRAALGGTEPAQEAVAQADAAEPFLKGAVPLPTRRPAAGNAEFMVASVAVPTPRPVLNDASDETAVAAAAPAKPEEIVEVSLLEPAAEATQDPVGKLLASEEAIDPVAVADTGVKTTDKGAKPKAGDGRKARKPVAVPVTKDIGQFALSKETVTDNGKDVAAVTYNQESVWQAPTEVYVAGFSTEAPQNVNKFSGKAVNFLKVAKFKKTN